MFQLEQVFEIEAIEKGIDGKLRIGLVSTDRSRLTLVTVREELDRHIFMIGDSYRVSVNGPLPEGGA